MDWLHHTVDALGRFTVTQQMWLLSLFVIGSQGYWAYLRYASRERRQLAEHAHSEINALLHLTTEAERHFRESQHALIAIDKALNSLSIAGPERVGMLLAEIRINVGKCLEEIEAVHKLVNK